MLDSIKQHKKSRAVIILLSSVVLSSIITAVVNYAKPECTKSLVNLFGGEKGFALAVTLVASIPLALIALGIAVSHNKNLNYVRILDEVDNIPRIVITVDKNCLSVTGSLDELMFNDDKADVIKDSSEITIKREKRDGEEDYYRVISYNGIRGADYIRGMLFLEGERLKSITVFPSAKARELSASLIENAFARMQRQSKLT
ncbi:MAG: hypothetical protein U0X86_000657 [Wolbachia endosymbiont of Xenopsylla cheopis]